MAVNGRKDEIKSLDILIDHDLSTQLFDDQDYNKNCIQNALTKNNKEIGGKIINFIII